jgi:hypothetical protein
MYLFSLSRCLYTCRFYDDTYLLGVCYSSFPFFRGAEAIEEQLESALEEVVKRNFAVDLTRHRYLNLRDCG